MIPGVPVGELAWLALAIIAGGVVTGVLAGLFGIGGGAIIVPVLYEVFRVIGVPEEAQKYAAVLGANYPGNKWYEKAYKLMQKNAPGTVVK